MSSCEVHNQTNLHVQIWSDYTHKSEYRNEIISVTGIMYNYYREVGRDQGGGKRSR